ncbi:MAG TPA: hypothetical protein V6D23_22125 [Candidatus Obscuribacterales bacterium]
MEHKDWTAFLKEGELPHRETLKKWLKDPEKSELTILGLALSPQLTSVALLLNAISKQPYSMLEDILEALWVLSYHYPEELIRAWSQASLSTQAAVRPVLAQLKNKQKYVGLLGQHLQNTNSIYTAIKILKLLQGIPGAFETLEGLYDFSQPLEKALWKYQHVYQAVKERVEVMRDIRLIEQTKPDDPASVDFVLNILKKPLTHKTPHDAAFKKLESWIKDVDHPVLHEQISKALSSYTSKSLRLEIIARELKHMLAE